ncbi:MULTISPECIES: tail assembly protein [Sinorhizobium]|uniref:tail assembly protein n=1 Tax=Sinorhizobium TaxID=28105 RepID=UPI00036ADB0D|nr:MULTISPECIES: tail assembly protein [Sinorhizobium]MDX0609409.1 tail assembly protein [Sinorhizobium medicae]MDX0621294.1 tail assembly protein [Sinorhizobium medicae]MDX0640540.1 tail assembly protein [Sinorhizobium medicae]MDX0666929.1 tail assembly protein [Sinorhizobium medicae]MDX0678512.1 tail assembly protein [Sinorhizobium medicae]
MTMIDVRLHGVLAERYGPEHQFAINSPREAIAALEANYPGFRRDFLAVKNYALICDGDWRDEENCPDVANAPVAKEIDICPVIEGRIDPVSWIAAGITAISGGAITGVAATVIAGGITLGLLLGASLLLSPKPKRPTGDDGNKNENYIFSGPENVTEQGVAVPLIYGRCFVGSVVISAGLEVADDVTTETGNSWVWNQMAAAAGLLDMSFDDPAMARAALVQEPPAEPEETYPPGRSPRWWPENA